MTPSENCLRIVRYYESYRELAYKYPAGVWTYGYGFTRRPDGTRVRAGDTISRPEAEGLLCQRVEKFADEIHAAMPKACLEQHELDALTSFVYSIGITKFLGSSIFKTIRACRTKDPEMHALFLRWVYTCGNPQAALIRRRMTEAHLYEAREVVLTWPAEAVTELINSTR